MRCSFGRPSSGRGGSGGGGALREVGDRRAAIAAAGGTVNAPYLKDDLRVTIVSAILSGLAIPAATFFAFVAFFALL